VKKAILNLRLVERYLCAINSSVALKNFKSVCKYDAILIANDLWLKSIRFVTRVIVGICTRRILSPLYVFELRSNGLKTAGLQGYNK